MEPGQPGHRGEVSWWRSTCRPGETAGQPAPGYPPAPAGGQGRPPRVRPAWQVPVAARRCGHCVPGQALRFARILASATNFSLAARARPGRNPVQGLRQAGSALSQSPPAQEGRRIWRRDVNPGKERL